ncbi:MAG: NepR family anti-sigma factor [Xanthobacteraceae bacterium]
MKSRKTNLDTVEPVSDDPQNPMANSMARHPHKEARLDREAQHRIGELLRGMYNTYVDQGIPQNLADLVRRIGDAEQE